MSGSLTTGAGVSGTTGQVSGNSFTKKLIDVTFKLGQGSFGTAGTDTVKLSGLRCSATIIKAGGQSMSMANVRVWGMTLEMMNKLSTLGLFVTQVRRNVLIVEAGDEQAGMSVVFEGTIQDAWADFGGMPDVPFVVQAFAGLEEAIKPVPPTSYRGPTDVATIMLSLANQMGLAFENTGVQGVVLADPYFPGTAREQALRVAAAANINMSIDVGKLAIWPKGKERGSQVPVISPETGMIGYPSYTSKGVVVRSLYNPNVAFGSKIQINSSLKPASGQWIVYMLQYHLESQLPNGEWSMMMEAAPPGFGPPIA